MKLLTYWQLEELRQWVNNYIDEALRDEFSGEEYHKPECGRCEHGQ